MDFARYLQAKRTVDDRAVDRRVVELLREQLSSVASPTVLEVACGIGIGAERLLDWGIVESPRYLGIDRAAELIDVARERLSGRPNAEVATCSLEEFSAQPVNRARFDLVMAHAFLDIVPLDESLERLLGLARPNGLLYLPITFDGESIFEPARPDDDAVLTAYHGSMDVSGRSRTGRSLYHALRGRGAEVLALGSSDWIVHPFAEGYAADEAYFLECVVEMVENTVGEESRDWAAQRREQIERGLLVYVAHQLDALARRPAR